MNNKIETKYFDKIVDDFGIWHSSDGAEPIRDNGYTTADSAEALIIYLLLENNEKSDLLFSFINKSLIGDNFLGVADKNRNFLPDIADSLSLGKIMWASGFSYSKKFHIDDSVRLINKSTTALNKNNDIYGLAFGLLGAVYVNKELSNFYFKKIKSFFTNTTEDWMWFEPTVKGNSGIIPYSLLRYGMIFNNDDSIKLGQNILKFLEKCCTYERHRGPIGNNGWFSNSTKIAPNFAQSPVDASYMSWAWLVAYQISNDSFDKERHDAWMQWFEGSNILRVKMYDPFDMHCFDSIEEWGVAYTSSAQSNASFILSKLMSLNNISI